MRGLAAAITLALALAWTPTAFADEMPADLRLAAEAFDVAQHSGDRAELERLVADDYRLFGSDGAAQNKAQFIADFTSPNFDIDPFTIEEFDARMFGDTAILTGRVALSGTSSGNRFTVNLRFSDVWVKRDGQWQVVFAQTTRIP
jgi:hypothetical protein